MLKSWRILTKLRDHFGLLIILIISVPVLYCFNPEVTEAATMVQLSTSSDDQTNISGTWSSATTEGNLLVAEISFEKAMML